MRTADRRRRVRSPLILLGFGLALLVSQPQSSAALDDQRRAGVDAAEKTMLAQYALYVACAKKEALRFAASREPAEIAARSALARCSPQFGRFKRLAFDWGMQVGNWSFAKNENFTEKQKDGMLDGVIRLIVETRGKRPRAPEHKTPSAPSTAPPIKI
jgi:hypothetical protein